jgi:Protein of unknown function (DUF3300)
MVALCGLAGLTYATIGPRSWFPSYAQEQTATAAPDPLSDDEMEVLVARIALYPDDLVAAIVAASLYPVQIVQAQRYLEKVKTKSDLKPDKDWDGSVISLLNYPDVVKMMSDDLDWTEELGEAVTNQEKDLLEAIQQLRDRAVAKGVLKSDEKTVVVHQNDNVVIQPAKANEVYVPVYEPQMLYEPNYAPAPISYYPEPYPSYYYPTAPYFAGFVTGAFWGAAVDWDDGFWGGNGNWDNDLNIDCNNCFNDRNFNGKVNWNDVDWSKVDRSKMNFDRSQFSKLDKNKMRDGLKANGRNDLRNRGRDLKRNRPSTLPAQGNRQAKDVRKSTLEGLKNKSGNKAARPADRARKAGQGGAGNKAGQGGAGNRVNQPSRGNAKRAGQRPSGGKVNRPSGKPKPGARQDMRSKRPSPMGDVTRGRNAKAYSNRGARSMGGGMRGGGRPQMYRPRGGGGGGGRGGGGRRR